MNQPNILFIMTDQQSRHMMSCTGYPYVQTPAMDSLAETGVRFERAYCTNPVCVPSRFSLFTGRMPSEIKLQDNGHVRLKEIPEEIKRTGLGWPLKEVGYKTVYAGKQHFPHMTAEELGFDVLTYDERDELAQMSAGFVAQEHEQPWCLVASFINPHDICYMGIRDHVEGELQEGIIRRGTVPLGELDDALAKSEEFPDDEFWGQHCPPLPPNHQPQDDEPEAIQALLKLRSFRANARENWDDDHWRLHRWAYAKLTERVDGQIGKLLESLKQSPHADNTLIIFTSDHGDHNASHKLEHKTIPYEEAAGIPLIINAPGGTEGKVDNKSVVSNGLDLFPTICDFAGVDIPKHLQGHSLRPLVEGNEGLRREAISIECEIGNAVVSQQHMYMQCFEGEHAEQFYDFEQDPHQTRNSILNNPQGLKKHRDLFSILHPHHEETRQDLLNLLS
jgi:arylsulfatase A-like enzyme